jgi:hypothetical protein
VLLLKLTKENYMFYVYVYKDPRPTNNRRVVYVGKGIGNRMWDHWNKAVHNNKGFGNFLALLRRDGMEPIVEVVADNLDEASAFVEEIRLIATYGRRDLKAGFLFNLTDGGEGLSGALRTPEWSANISATLSSPEQKSRNAQAALIRWADPDYRARTTEAIREALKDPGVIARREAGKAAFVDTPEFRAVMSRATSKMWEDPEYFEKVRAAQVVAQNRPEVAAKRSAASVKRWEAVGDKMASAIKKARNTDASKAKTSAQAKEQWADPEYAAKQTANNKEIANREDVKAAKKAAAKALWADPVWRAKMLAARQAKKIASNL